MADDISKLFSEKAVKNLRDPEQLDSFIRLTSPVGWVVLIIIALILLAVTIWGFLGSIPVRVLGQGVIVTQDSLSYTLNAKASGTVKKISVKTGEYVNKDAPLVTIEFPIMDVDLDNLRKKLEDLEQYLKQEQSFNHKDIEQRRENMKQIIQSLQKSIADTEKHLEYQRSLLATREDELSKGYVTRQQVEVTRTQIYSLEEEVRSSRSKIEEARIAFVEYENANHKTIRQIKQEILATRSQLREEQREHKIDHLILSPIDGFVAEIDTELGAFVEANEQVAVIRRIGEDFQALSFFKIKDGKKIKPGMLANVSPTSVERDLYGSIRGKVVSVSVLPESEAGLGEALDNSILVQEIISAGAVLRVVIELEETPETFSGLKWTSSDGPPVKISVATIASSSVTVREEAPINFVIPIFKAWVLEE